MNGRALRAAKQTGFGKKRRAIVGSSAPAAAAPSIFPLLLSGRSLTTSSGTPRLLVADAAWGLIARLSPTQVDSYITDRVSRGFNAAIVMLIAKHSSINGGSSVNYNGDAPFSGTALIPANIGAAYFSHADLCLTKLANAGMTVILCPCYSGFGGPGTSQGWWDSLTDSTVASNWGAWVGNRYKNQSNIIWVNGGDYTPDPGSQQTISEAVSTGIVGAGATQLHTYHGARGDSAYAIWGTAKTWLTLGDIYTDDLTIYSAAATEYARSGPKGFTQLEDFYANNTTMSGAIVEKWQALCSGCAGILEGDENIWPFSTGYAANFGSDAELGVAALASLCASYKPETLVPKTDTSLISNALGSGTSRICGALGTYSGGGFAFIAVPAATSPTLVAAAISQSSFRVRRMDPKTGALTTLSGSPFSNSGSNVTLTHPGNNSMGTPLVVWVVD